MGLYLKLQLDFTSQYLTRVTAGTLFIYFNSFNLFIVKTDEGSDCILKI